MNAEKSKPTAPGNLVLRIPLRLTVVLSVAVVVFTIVYLLLPNSRPTLTFLGIAAAGAGAALTAYAIWRGLGITIEQREIQIAEQKVYRALEFLKRWNDPNLAPVRARWRLILDEVEHGADTTYRIIEDDPTSEARL